MLLTHSSKDDSDMALSTQITSDNLVRAYLISEIRKTKAMHFHYMSHIHELSSLEKIIWVIGVLRRAVVSD